MHGIHPDAEGRVANPVGLGHQHHRPLGRVIAGQVLIADQAVHGGEVDDRAGLPRHHVAYRVLVQKNGPRTFTAKVRSQSATSVS